MATFLSGSLARQVLKIYVWQGVGHTEIAPQNALLDIAIKLALALPAAPMRTTYQVRMLDFLYVKNSFLPIR